MSFPATIDQAILDKVLGNLVVLFLAAAGGVEAIARQTAISALACLDPRTDEELRLAADTAGFGFHSLDCLAQSAAPGLSVKEVLQLRTCAVSLSRQSNAAQRKLDRLQRDRPAAAKTAPAPRERPMEEAQPETPAADDAGCVAAPPAMNEPAPAKEAPASPSWQARNKTPEFTAPNRQRQAAQRIADNLARNAARQAGQATIHRTAI